MSLYTMSSPPRGSGDDEDEKRDINKEEETQEPDD